MYSDHVDRAARYAALALATSAPREQARAVAVLQDDLAAILAGTTRLVTGLSAHLPVAVDAADVGRHPVQAMLNRLTAFPSHDPDDGSDRDPPSARWTGRPAGPGDAVDALGVWKGLVVETHLARSALETHPGLSDTERWAVLGDVAVLAHVLALNGQDLLDEASVPAALARRVRSHTAALMVESHEVARLAAAAPTKAPEADLPTRAAAGVISVNTVGDLPRAVDNLAHLVRSDDVSTSDVLALTRMLAQLGNAAGIALTTGAGPAADDPLRVAGAALTAHARALSVTVTTHRHRLASANPGSGLALTQGREIGAAATPRLADLNEAPERATAAAGDIQRYAGAVPAVLGAMTEALNHLERTHQAYVTDTSWDAAYRWRPAVAGDLNPLREALTQATALLPVTPLSPAPARPSPGRHELQAALARREAAMRPSRPSAAVLTGQFASKRQPVIRR